MPSFLASWRALTGIEAGVLGWYRASAGAVHAWPPGRVEEFCTCAWKSLPPFDPTHGGRTGVWQRRSLGGCAGATFAIALSSAATSDSLRCEIGRAHV